MDNKKDISAVLFDLDGTILDTSPGIYNGIDYMLPQFGKPALSPEDKVKMIGPPLSDSYPRILGLTGKRMEEAIKVYRDYCRNQGYKEFDHYPGMKELLEALKAQDIQIFVVTMKEQSIAELTMAASGYDYLLDGVIGNTDINSATKSELVDRLISEKNFDKDKVILIGDTDIDAEGAFKSEIDFFPAMFGFGYSHNGFNDNYPYREKLNKPLDLLNYVK